MSAIEQWLPHRAPFRFVDALVSVEAETGRFALVLAPDDPRLSEGWLQPLYVAEALAQSTAAFNGHHRQDGPELGMLVEMTASFHGAARGGEVVDLEVRRVREHGALGRYLGRASVGGRLLVEAELTVVRDTEARHD